MSAAEQTVQKSHGPRRGTGASVHRRGGRDVASSRGVDGRARPQASVTTPGGPVPEFLEASGDLGGAEAALHAALVEAPSLPQISKNLGDICYRLGRFDDAWDAYQRAVRLHPNLGDDLHFKLGNLALKRGDPASARGYWGRAVELNPRHQLARANLQTLGTNG